MNAPAPPRGHRPPALFLFLPFAAALAVNPGLGAPMAPTDAIDETVAVFFRSYQHDVAALSPDGRRVALSENLPGKPPAIAIVQVDDRSSSRTAASATSTAVPMPRNGCRSTRS